MSRFISGIIIAACVAAIGRGIVFAFGLDVLVAQGIWQITNAAADHVEAIAWLLSGSLALTAFMVWTSLHLDQKISNLFSSKPTIESLPSVGQVLRISQSVSQVTSSRLRSSR